MPQDRQDEMMSQDLMEWLETVPTVEETLAELEMMEIPDLSDLCPDALSPGGQNKPRAKENDMNIDETVQSLSARTQKLVTETCSLVAYLDDQTGYDIRNIRRMTQAKMAMWRLEDARMHLDEVPRCTVSISIEGE